jgi:hypothetical protein
MKPSAEASSAVRSSFVSASPILGGYAHSVTQDPQRVLDDLGRLALRAPSRTEFFDEAAARLKRAVPFDGACWHALDPGSDLITQHRLQDIDKTGARSRGELSATLFFGEHLPRIEHKVAIGDDAWFVDAPRPRDLDVAPI